VECVQSCWTQECTQRPTAQMIKDYFKSPSSTVLRNTYQIGLSSLSAVLVMEQNENDDVSKQSVWIACFKEGSYNLVCYGFVEQSSLLQNMPEYQKRYLNSKLARPKLCRIVSVFLYSLLPLTLVLYI